MTNKKAFTLLELVIYIAIAAVLTTLVVRLYLTLEKAQQKAQTIQVVETEGSTAMKTMLQSVRNAQSVTAPALGSSGTSLTVVTTPASFSPTAFALTSGALTITEGSNPLNALTTKQVIVSGLSVQDFGAVGSYGSVKVQFTVSYASTTNRYDTSYSKTFYGSATVRRFPQ